MTVRHVSLLAMGPLWLAGCSPATAEDACLKRIEALSQERDAHIQQDVAKLRAMATKSENGQLSLEEQAVYADFMAEVEQRENWLNAEIQRCPEARERFGPALDGSIPVLAPASPPRSSEENTDAPNR
jgi:hypothetical protein